jgi:hypothetical protein
VQGWKIVNQVGSHVRVKNQFVISQRENNFLIFHFIASSHEVARRYLASTNFEKLALKAFLSSNQTIFLSENSL